jgi:E3 ubiquitin-protein ligase SHPRH
VAQPFSDLLLTAQKTVAPYNEVDHGNKPAEVLLASLKDQEKKLSTKLTGLRAKSRYLVHLRQDSTDSEAQRNCVICQTAFEIGALTICGHQYCKDCIRLWWNEHRSCPMCKRYLKRKDFHQITYKPQELKLQEETQTTNPSGSEHVADSGIYSGIRFSTLNQIKQIDLNGSFGTKIDTSELVLNLLAAKLMY